ncbi:uncharacterized protein N7484_001512 [Penicillium longicatenatum]|uniref:uncharacterized protein n=1 Tax=Penicillium longicatenatum TaxID=1561947 RepID=UPI002547AAF6|nr:uncharacterized protein N7484_001512 [Penicillium longicatenatum]KAJ5657863.1 hypothetical protein N7484_001512 [Penicillium longicatenatum]
MARGFVFRIQESMGQRAALILRSCPGPAFSSIVVILYWTGVCPRNCRPAESPRARIFARAIPCKRNVINHFPFLSRSGWDV